MMSPLLGDWIRQAAPQPEVVLPASPRRFDKPGLASVWCRAAPQPL